MTALLVLGLNNRNTIITSHIISLFLKYYFYRLQILQKREEKWIKFGEKLL